MKRSAQIGLLVMGALGTTTAAGYMATNRDPACQASAQSNPQATPGQNCRRSIWSGGGHGSGWSRPIFGGSSSSSPTGVMSGHPSSGTSASRGGFGGHAGGGSSGG